MMYAKRKTKDNIKARLGLTQYCKRKELELKEAAHENIYKPKPSYTLRLDERMAVCEWIKELRMPNEYPPNWIGMSM